jgi:hypothetical protein
MEGYLAASETHLIDSLNFENPKVAPYVLGRKQVRIAASGGNSYGPTGARTARFSLNTSGPAVDLSTLAVSGVCRNTDAAAGNLLTFLGPNMGVCIQSAKVLAGNVEIDRVEFYNRTEATLSLMQSEAKRIQEYSEGFGYAGGGPSGTDFTASTIAGANGTKRVVWRPKALGCLQTPMLWPTSFVSGGGVVLELTFVETGAEVCTSGANTSSSWIWEDMALLCDVVQLDPAFQGSLGAHLTNNGSISIHFKAYQTAFYSILAGSAQIIHARANTRLNSIWLTFAGDGPTGTDPGAGALKRVNQLKAAGETLRMRSQIGELTYPDYPITGLSEFYHRLIQGTGAAHSAAHAPCLTSESFAANGFIALQDFEACPHQAAGSGVNTFNSQLTLALEGITGGGTAAGINGAYLTTYHDVVMEISQSGVVVAV